MIHPNTIFDIGMHLGEDADYYLTKGCNVVAFEANPDLVQLCSARFRNEISSGQMTIVAGAIASPGAGETLKFYLNDKTVWSTIEPSWSERNSMLGTGSREIEVPRVDFPSALLKYGVPFFMKIDVEGVDQYVLDVVRGLAEKPLYISIESEKVDFDKLVSEIDGLGEKGYTRFRAVQQANISKMRVPVRKADGTVTTYIFQKHASGPFGDDLRQAWLSRDEVIKQYKAIFRLYRLFGDFSLLRRLPVIGQAVRLGSHFRYYPLPGWYDTHATYLP